MCKEVQMSKMIIKFIYHLSFSFCTKESFKEIFVCLALKVTQ